MDMLSRVAENLYWMSRYIERAENTARMVSVDVHLQLDFPESRPKGWANLLDITSSSDQFEARYNDFNEQNVMAFLCADKEYSGSLISSLAAARENLRTTRDIIPQEVWEEINALYMKVSARVAGGLVPSNREQFLKEIIRGCQTITGILEGSLSRTQASTFIRIGRHLERADMTTRIIDVRSGSLLPRDPSQLTPFENLEWMSVLKSLTGYQMYRQQIRVRVRAADVLEFLAKDRHFPRSICYCLNTLSEELRHLPHHDRPLASATLIQAEVAETDFRLLAKSPDDLSNTMDQFQVDFNALHESICSNFFARKGIEQSLENQTQTAPNDMLDED